MSENSSIEWTDHTWSPWEGCTKVSEGCTHCYAESRNHRFGSDNWGKGKPRRLTKNWSKPLVWQKKAEQALRDHSESLMWDTSPKKKPCPPRVFPSLCDPFDEEVPVEWFILFMELIWKTPNIDWLLLTKRPRNWAKRLHDADVVLNGMRKVKDEEVTQEYINEWLGHCPPKNVWMGVSIENQKNDHRWQLLAEIPAMKRFVSFEPLIGPIDVRQIYDPKADWVIIGGESGRGARPCNLEWIRTLKNQCQDAGIATFVKQIGSNPVMEPGPVAWLTEDPKGGDMSEWPEDLRIREMPS